MMSYSFQTWLKQTFQNTLRLNFEKQSLSFKEGLGGIGGMDGFVFSPSVEMPLPLFLLTCAPMAHFQDPNRTEA